MCKEVLVIERETSELFDQSEPIWKVSKAQIVPFTKQIIRVDTMENILKEMMR